MAREKGYASTETKVIVPEEVKAVLKGARGKPVKTKKTLIKQGHKGYKNFVSWS